MKRLTILLMFGGESSEHDVSLKSAKNIHTAIDKNKYDVILSYIDTTGRWWLLDEWTDAPDDKRTTQLVISPGTKTLLTVPGNDILTIDVLFPVLHGKFGEDGTIQGLADMAHIPVVGPGVESSAICMDKHVTKHLLEASGIPVVPWVSVTSGEDVPRAVRRAKALDGDGPWFVKPSRAGSSVGVTKVTDLADMPSAIMIAHEQDSLALIETAIIGRELEVAVLGNAPTHKASGIGEIVAGGEFYNYEEKYSTESSSRVVLDANLPKALARVIRQHALDAYTVLGCRGMSRVDFLLSDELVPYVMEVNTLPGFTDISMYPKLWQQKGVEQTELIDRLITLATE